MKIPAKFKEYIWLVNTIYRAGEITLVEINEKWLQTEMSEGVPLSRTTFHRHRIAIEEIFGRHTLFAGKLKFLELKEFTILTCYEERLPFNNDAARSSRRPFQFRFRRFVDLQHRLFAIRRDEGCPCSWNRTQSTDKVVDLLSWLTPVDLAGFLENLRGGF